MALVPVFRSVGLSYGLSVTASSHAAVQVTRNSTESSPWALFSNPSTTLSVYVLMGQTSAVAAAAIPGDGTSPTAVFQIGPMQQIALPAPYKGDSFWVTAIASGAGPTLLTVIPVMVS